MMIQIAIKQFTESKFRTEITGRTKYKYSWEISFWLLLGTSLNSILSLVFLFLIYFVYCRNCYISFLIILCLQRRWAGIGSVRSAWLPASGAEKKGQQIRIICFLDRTARPSNETRRNKESVGNQDLSWGYFSQLCSPCLVCPSCKMWDCFKR